MKTKRISIMRSAVGILVLIIVLALTPIAAEADSLTIEFQAGDYQILEKKQGQLIQMDDFGYIMVPGKPMLPSRNFLIALPPGARVLSTEVRGARAKQLPGVFRIMPTPAFLPLVNQEQRKEITKELQREWQQNNQAVYGTNHAYPIDRGKLVSSGSLRKYSYASVSFYPFSYFPQSGVLLYYDRAEITLRYSLPSPGSRDAKRIEELKRDTLADKKASRLFVNYSQVRSLYRPPSSPPPPKRQAHDYVIITTSDLLGAITSSNFLSWKSSLGFNIRTVLTSDSEITGQSGTDLAEKIRNFLRNYYGTWGIEYVLIVGDYATVPMRYCYPDPTNHATDPGNPNTWGAETPTDHYYADLSDPDALSWDSDLDGFHGEYGEDNPDFLAEVSVGRIPTSNTSRITYALNKLVTFEQDVGTWKDSALHPGSILFYENENHNGYSKIDGATVLNAIENDFMAGWSINHSSEQEGLDPSGFAWPAISEAACTGDWRSSKYGVVNWAGHGWFNQAARSIWVSDDGDGVPEGSELSMPSFINSWCTLEDDYPSIVFAVSCMVGYPEPTGEPNLGVSLLVKPTFGSSVGVVSASRPAAVSGAWPTSPGGAESLCYEFNRYMIDGPEGPEKVGDALYDSKFFCNYNYGWAYWYEYLNMFDYNLYGDPSLAREGRIGTNNSIPTISEWGVAVFTLVIVGLGIVILRKKMF